jgi:hypothetical protein
MYPLLEAEATGTGVLQSVAKSEGRKRRLDCVRVGYLDGLSDP